VNKQHETVYMSNRVNTLANESRTMISALIAVRKSTACDGRIGSEIIYLRRAAGVDARSALFMDYSLLMCVSRAMV